MPGKGFEEQVRGEEVETTSVDNSQEASSKEEEKRTCLKKECKK